MRWEPRGSTSNAWLAGGKEKLLQYWSAEKVRFFAQYYWPAGHNVTDYDRWVGATTPYEVAFQPNYEPWGIVHRCVMGTPRSRAGECCSTEAAGPGTRRSLTWSCVNTLPRHQSNGPP